MFLQKYTYICWIHTDAMNNRCTQEDFFSKMYLSLYCKGLKRVTQGLRVRGCWRPNITEIFWPQSYGRQRCVCLVLQGCSTGGPGPICWVMAFFIASYQQLLWSPNSIGVPEGPLDLMWLSLPHLIYNSFSNCNSNSTVVLTELYNSSTPTRSPTRSLKSNV